MVNVNGGFNCTAASSSTERESYIRNGTLGLLANIQMCGVCGACDEKWSKESINAAK